MLVEGIRRKGVVCAGHRVSSGLLCIMSFLRTEISYMFIASFALHNVFHCKGLKLEVFMNLISFKVHAKDQ